MFIRTYLFIAAMMLGCGLSGCFVELLSPEEEAELMDDLGEDGPEVVVLEDESAAKESDSQDNRLLEKPTDVDGLAASANMMWETGKPDPTPWSIRSLVPSAGDGGMGSAREGSEGAGKPDPTPWLRMNSRLGVSPWWVRGGGE